MLTVHWWCQLAGGGWIIVEWGSFQCSLLETQADGSTITQCIVPMSPYVSTSRWWKESLSCKVRKKTRMSTLTTFSHRLIKLIGSQNICSAFSLFTWPWLGSGCIPEGQNLILGSPLLWLNLPSSSGSFSFDAQLPAVASPRVLYHPLYISFNPALPS